MCVPPGGSGSLSAAAFPCNAAADVGGVARRQDEKREGKRGGLGNDTGVRLGSPDQSRCLSVVKIIRYKALVEFASIDLPSVVLVAVVLSPQEVIPGEI